MVSFQMERIVFKRSKCNGCSICTTNAPQIWCYNSIDGKADLLDAEFKKDSYFRVLWPEEVKVMKEIESICPTRAIQLLK
jgi:ferredoxin